MKGKRFSRRLFIALVIALLASGTAALADNVPVSELDAIEQGVVLYEKMQGEEIEISDAVANSGYDETFIKSVMLGYVNLEEYEQILAGDYIRKQDFMNILYKTIIGYDNSFAIDAYETEEILNDCYDNAYLDEENRTAYAFMMKAGFFENTVNTNPNADLTWDGCAILVEQVYNLFVSDESVNIGSCTIKVGANIETVTRVLGMPNRIDESDYDFDWYVYDSDYSKFVMVGVKGDRICAFFTNSGNFEYKGLINGCACPEYLELSENTYVFYDEYGFVDAIMYNPSYKDTNKSSNAKYSRAQELLDIINANRVKNGKTVYVSNNSLNSEAYLELIGRNDDTQSKLSEGTGFDIFTIYSNLVREQDEILVNDTPAIKAIGVAVSADAEEDKIEAKLVTNDYAVAGIDVKTTVEVQEKQEEIEDVKEVTTPIIVSPSVKTQYEGYENIVIELAIRAAKDYHIEIFDYENDDYVVNKYVSTDKKTFELPAELFEEGRDYKIIVSALDGDGTALSSEPVLISYGTKYHDGVKIVTPGDNAVTDDDCVAVLWESEQYSDFNIELFDKDGNLIVSNTVEGEKEALIRGVDPGEYQLKITALRKATVIEKAQDKIKFSVEQPIPVITEFILDSGAVYNYVYEDVALGVLYFYDEDIIEVEENGETVRKKKIIQKQVKATKGYRKLASMIEKVKSARGTDFVSDGVPTEMGNAIFAEAKKYLGVEYVWGGETPSGFDCSGLVKYVCNSLGIDVSRVAEDQFAEGMAVNKEDLIPGDLVFFENNGYIHHVGIYAGDGMMIHAPRTGDVVKYTSLDNEYYKNEYAGARRVY